MFPFLRHYTYAIVFNSSRKPFRGWQVRRALNYAIDRPALLEKAFRGHGQETSGPAWPLHWAYDGSAPEYGYDPSRAMALLDAAGIPPVSRSARNEKAPARLRFSCLIPDSFLLWERIALIVQRDLAQIGVDMQIESVPFEEFNRRIASGNFDAVTLEFIVGNSPSRPYTFWYSQSKQNVWGYANPSMDQSLDRIRRASTESEYREAFRQFQAESLHDPPAIFLALSQTARAINRRFQVIAPPGSDILPTIADWRPNDAEEMTN
jgi:peptide/nickel transport system substrate-binding protein